MEDNLSVLLGSAGSASLSFSWAWDSFILINVFMSITYILCSVITVVKQFHFLLILCTIVFLSFSGLCVFLYAGKWCEIFKCQIKWLMSDSIGFIQPNVDMLTPGLQKWICWAFSVIMRGVGGTWSVIRNSYVQIPLLIL